MADRFDEMAREIQHSIGWVDLTRLAAALRAESKRAQEAMRERAKAALTVGLNMSRRSWTAPMYEAVKEKAVEIVSNLPIEE